MSLRVYNTLTRTKELFEPVQPGKVGIYLCGPTVYKPAHIGHAVGPIVFDAIKRYLTYKGFDVTWVVNITDVDDKLIAEAAAQQTTVTELADRVTRQYLEGLAALDIRSIDHMPKVSEHIADIVALIQRLIDQGFAYVADGGDVYFDVAAAKDYGKLSGRDPDEQLETSREGLHEDGKRHRGDFGLWKAAKPDEPPEVRFDSPWGPGRPGWHIECSAMSMKYLGETMDIHGGGMDLVFPHHENEIVQSECATGKPFARYWLHNGLTRVRTKAGGAAKMSKSLGNVMDLADLLGRYDPEVIRLFVLSTHYRRPIDFSAEALDATARGMETFVRLFERLGRFAEGDLFEQGSRLERLVDLAGDSEPQREFIQRMLDTRLKVLESMDDDFNTAAAIGVLYEQAGEINRFVDRFRLDTTSDDAGRQIAVAAGRSLIGSARIIGLFERSPLARRAPQTDARVDELMQLLIDLRAEARKQKNFPLADAIRQKLGALGITLDDRPDGTTWRRG